MQSHGEKKKKKMKKKKECMVNKVAESQHKYAFMCEKKG